ncbi:hypothetical protein QTO34_012594 [Cnephaeus nilssonii]|uniref:Ig-like domain-containing protein n=1 Tax=Cnephaeus nilssonii TaxID=3371016 RepID=A0AA40LCH9_CNENI|nr:hypothetical protein QTO34_012594 [Eptesicus nilssonii]
MGKQRNQQRKEKEDPPEKQLTAKFTIAKIWKQPKCPSADEWIKQLWYIYTMEYYTVVKKKEFLPFATAWMELESIMLIGIGKAAPHANFCLSSRVNPLLGCAGSQLSPHTGLRSLGRQSCGLEDKTAVSSPVQLQELGPGLEEPSQTLSLNNSGSQRQCVTCTVSGFSLISYHVHWIRQAPGKRLEWVRVMWAGGNTNYNPTLKSRLSITRDTSKSQVYLTLNSLKDEDTAVYARETQSRWSRQGAPRLKEDNQHQGVLRTTAQKAAPEARAEGETILRALTGLCLETFPQREIPAQSKSLCAEPTCPQRVLPSDRPTINKTCACPKDSGS